jgi:hypothetical protein
VIRFSLRHALAGLTVGLLVVGIAGCRPGSTLHGGGYQPSPGPTPSTSSTPAPATSGLDARAVARYGQAKVQAAAREMIHYTFRVGWNDRLIATHVDQVTMADFAPAVAFMTPSCARTFTAAFARVAKHDKVATRNLQGAILFGIRGPHGSAPIRTGKIVTDTKYSNVQVGLTSGTNGHLTMQFTASANIHLRNPDGKGYVISTSRKIRYLLVPNTGTDAGARPFLIDGWSNRLTVGQVRAG